MSNIFYILLIALCMLTLYIYISYSEWHIRIRRVEHFSATQQYIDSDSTDTNTTKNTAEGADIATPTPKINNDTYMLEKTQLIGDASEPAHKLKTHIINTYINNMDKVNIFARGYNKRENLINLFNNSIVNITDDEYYRLKDMIIKLMRDIKLRVPKLYTIISILFNHLIFIKFIDKLEGGMPHTHATAIFAPESFYRQPSETTFIHELCHIWQRYNMSVWNILYKKVGFIYVPDIYKKVKGIEEFIGRNRYNPDGLDINWLWADRKTNKLYWIGAIYPLIDNGFKLTVVNYVCIPISIIRKKGGTLADYMYIEKKWRDLASPALLKDNEAFMEWFGISINNYHPNEIGAQYLEEYYRGSSSALIHSAVPGFKIFMEWIENEIDADAIRID